MSMTFRTRAALASLALVWVAPGLADTGACLNDSDKKVCVQLSAQPDQVVQASRLDGATDTYVYYTARVTNISTPTSSRNVNLTFTLSPAVTLVEFSNTGTGRCSISGPSLSCNYDKFAAAIPETITLVATAPRYAGDATPATLVNTGVFGWNGRTSTISKTLTVSTSGGYSWVPAGKSVTLTTAPENPDPSLQATPEDPLFAKMIIPARNQPFLAYLAINLDANEDRSLVCTGGVYAPGNSDGGPYICRDIGGDFDAGDADRWVETAIDESVDGSFTDLPVQYVLIWDDSIVSAAQLTTTPAMPTGTPPIAVLFRASDADDPIRAHGKACGTNPVPCISGVQQYGTGDWTATLQVSKVDDDTPADPALSTDVLGAFKAVLDGLLQPAWALPLKPPSIMN